MSAEDMITEFTEAAGRATRVADVQMALEELTQARIGVKLFTLMTFDRESRLARRSYTNMPDAYPSSGTKPVGSDHWTAHVLDGRNTFVANDIESIAAVFDDYELIRSLGCESVLNVPVVVGNEVLGTINCLHEAGFYTADKVAAAESLKLPGSVCFLMEKLNKGGL